MKKTFFILVFIFGYNLANAQVGVPLSQATPSTSYLQKIKQSTPAIFLVQHSKKLIQNPCAQKAINSTQNFALAAINWRTYHNFAIANPKRAFVISSSCMLGLYGAYGLFNYWRAYNQAVTKQTQQNYVTRLLAGYKNKYIQHESEVEPYHKIFCQSLNNNIDNYRQLKKLNDLPTIDCKKLDRFTGKFYSAIFKQQESFLKKTIAKTNHTDYLFSLEELENQESSTKFRQESLFKSNLFEAMKAVIEELSQPTPTTE